MSQRSPIVVTGAAGFIGKRLAELLELQGETVVRWTRTMGDLRDPVAVAIVMREIDPSLIFHLAACSGSAAQTEWDLPAGEVAMVQNLADALPPGGKMVHAASMSEFGYGGTLTETSPKRPRSIYGFAKACATDRALVLSASGACDIRVGCLFGVYGPGEAGQRLVPYLVSHLANGREATLGDCKRLRDFVHVDDVCRLLIQLAQLANPPQTMVNIGTGVGVTIEQVGGKVARWLDADPKLLCYGVQPTRPIDEDILVADTSQLRSLFSSPQQHWLIENGLARDYVLQCAMRSNP
jgi:nucleoside-diphosphate-sugar epimerase